MSCAPIVHRYEEHGGGELPAFAWARPGPAPREVDAVDGLLLALSPWAVRNVRFDESLRLEFGHDVDYCRSVRRAGRKVMTADLRVVQHRALELAREIDLWVEAHIQLAESWDDGSADAAEWKRRARRAEAEREAARAIAYSRGLALDARVAELERAMEEATATPRGASPSRCAGSTAARRRAAATGARRQPLVAERAADLVLRDDAVLLADARAVAQPRQPLGEGERARREQPPQHGLLAREPVARLHSSTARAWDCARWCTRLPSSRSSTGWRSNGSRIRATSAAHGAAVCQTAPKPKNAGTTASRRPSRSATKSSTAVRTPLRGPPSSAAEPRYGSPPGRSPGSPGTMPPESPATGRRNSAGICSGAK